MSDEFEKAIRIEPFSGKQEDWQVWSEQFLARARRKGFKDILKGKVTVPTDDEMNASNLSADDVKKMKRIRELNDVAYEALLLLIDGKSQSGRVAFKIVSGSKSEALPDGDATLAWSRLNKKYEPKTAPSRLMLKKKFTSSVLRNVRDDPDEWLTDLENLKDRLNEAGSKCSDEELLEHALNNLPKEYEHVVAKLEDRLGDASNPLTIEDLRDELNLKYERMGFRNGKGGGKHSGGGNDGEDAAFFAGGYKGKCNACGEWGHKAKFCKKTKQGGNDNPGGGGGDFKWKCFRCGEKGHKAKDCPTRKDKKKDHANMANNEDSFNDIAFMVHEKKVRIANNNYFIADSGASCHLIGSDEGMVDWEPIDDDIIIGDGKSIKAVKVGKVRMTLKQQDGLDRVIMLTDVKYVPELGPYNLFSINQALSKGFQLGNEGRTITLTKGDFKMAFDKVIETKTNWLAGVEMIPIVDGKTGGKLKSKRYNRMDVNIFHEIFGHVGEEATKLTAGYYKFSLKGEFEPCESCAKGKARQKNLGHSDDSNKTTNPGERLAFDVGSVKTESLGGSKYWLLVVDYATNFAWSFFLKRRSDVAETMFKLVNEIKAFGYKVKYLRCDNGGENKGTEEYLKERGVSVKFEYSAPETPQQNGKVEWKFATLFGWIRAMLNAAGLEGELRQRVWAEAAKTATINDGIIVTGRNEKPSYERFYRTKNPIVQHLRRFGEIGIVTTKEGIQGKLENKGQPMMFLGYADKHSAETYRFLNLETMRVCLSRDVRWLGLTYRQWVRKGESVSVVELDVTHCGNDEEEKKDEDETEDPTTQPVTGGGNARNIYENLVQDNRRLIRELSRLEDHFNPGVTEAGLREQATTTGVLTRARAKGSDEAIGEEVTGNEDTTMDQTNVAINCYGSDIAMIAKSKILLEEKQVVENVVTENTNEEHPLVQLKKLLNEKGVNSKDREKKLHEIVTKLKENLPKTFEEAWNHPDELMREYWRAAIHKEFRDMINRGVWRTIKRRDMPTGRRLVKNKWVFDIKRDGRFRARLVACGYSQVPGIDFQNSYAPTINDVTWRILLVLMVLRKYEGRVVDVETAFLYGELDEDIYMENPPGLGNGPDECVKLEKAIYGLVQAARQYYKFFVKVLTDIGFELSKADPCLLVRRNDKGTVYFGVWVDDSLVIGDPEAIDSAIDDLKKKGLVLKIAGSLKDYLSCEITFSADGKRAWVHQPHLLKKLEGKFGEMVENLQEYRTPGTPGHTIMRNPKNVTRVSDEEQFLYRSGTGMLLYLVKYSRPDIANPVRELSKVLDGATPAAFKEMLRIIKYVIDTKDLALKIEPDTGGDTEIWRVLAFSDSDYASDPESRVSVSGWVIYFCGVLVAWQSKSQKSVTLSSSEAEYVALSEVAKNIKFIYMILESMGIKVELPIIVRVDNNGAIFMSENLAVSQRTKHVDIRYKFVNEFVEDGFLRIIFVRSEDNDADMFTKNLKGELHEKHSKKMIGEKGKSELEINRKGVGYVDI